jgi:hypothetical protein
MNLQATYDLEVETRRSATRIAREIDPRPKQASEAAAMSVAGRTNTSRLNSQHGPLY